VRVRVRVRNENKLQLGVITREHLAQPLQLEL